MHRPDVVPSSHYWFTKSANFLACWSFSPVTASLHGAYRRPIRGGLVSFPITTSIQSEIWVVVWSVYRRSLHVTFRKSFHIKVFLSDVGLFIVHWFQTIWTLRTWLLGSGWARTLQRTRLLVVCSVMVALTSIGTTDLFWLINWSQSTLVFLQTPEFDTCQKGDKIKIKTRFKQRLISVNT